MKVKRFLKSKLLFKNSMSHPKEAWTLKNHRHCFSSSAKGHSPFWKQDSLNKTLPLCNTKCLKAQGILNLHINKAQQPWKCWEKKLANSSLSAVLHIVCLPSVGQGHRPHISTSPLCKAMHAHETEKRLPASEIISAVTKWRDHSLALTQSGPHLPSL